MAALLDDGTLSPPVDLRSTSAGGDSLADLRQRREGGEQLPAPVRPLSLSGRRLINADLAGLDLSRCDLSGSDLSYANLRYANLSEADLRGANLTGANFDNATYSNHTEWPEGFNVPPNAVMED